MAYNKQNKYRKIIEIQNITIEKTNKGVSQVWVFHNIIYPRFLISYSTYCNYLTLNAKKEIKKGVGSKE